MESQEIVDTFFKFMNIKRIALLIGIILLLIINPYSINRVDAGHVGIKVKLAGDERGVGSYEYKTGFVFINDYVEKLYEFPTYQIQVKYANENTITKGGLPAVMSPSFNYSLKSDKVGDMFSNLRVDMDAIQSGWLHTAVIGAMNDVTNRWNIDDIFNKREQFESDIMLECNKRLSKWFTISQLRTNIIPPASLQNSILQKTQAIQEVQVAQNRKQVAIAQGETKIATAKADSAQLVIKASAESEAIKRKQLNLTPEYIEYIKVNKWNGVNSSTVLGGNSNPLINIK